MSNPESGTVVLRYLGTSCFELVRSDGKRLIVDPFLTGNPSAAITVGELEPPDLVLVTHGGFDHLGDAFDICRATGAMLFSSADVAIAARQLGIEVFPMVSGAHRAHAGFVVQAVEAHHVSITATENGFISGQPLSFVIWPVGESGVSIYHSGDTSVFSDMKLIAELYEPQIGLIGVGGPENLPHEMTAKEAAIAVDWLGVRRAIPMHWVPGAAHPGDFAAAVAARTPQVGVDVLQPGESLSVDA
jgi:L-ascorbate metabolism protein UlaG (beta-lactamase superfamily)